MPEKIAIIILWYQNDLSMCCSICVLEQVYTCTYTFQVIVLMKFDDIYNIYMGCINSYQLVLNTPY